MKHILLLLLLIIPSYFFSQCAEDLSLNIDDPIVDVFTVNQLLTFGGSVSISGEYSIIGEAERGIGSVGVYKRESENTWGLIQQIFPDSEEGIAFFGFEVAMSDNYAIVGSPGYSLNSFGPGAVFIYERNTSGIWEFKNRFDFPGTITPDTTGYGTSLSISSNGYAVVGSNFDSTSSMFEGSAYVYRRMNGGEWKYQQRLTSGSLESSVSYFGLDVAITSCDEIAISASQESGDGLGKIYIYKLIDDIWIQDARLEASNAAIDDRFGHSISFSNNQVAAIAERGGNGTVYVYENVDGRWDETILEASSFANGTINFVPGPGLSGNSLSLKGKTLIVSELGVAAHIFEKINENWVFVKSILPTTPDRFIFAEGIDMDSNSIILTIPDGGSIFENNTTLGVSEINDLSIDTLSIYPNPVGNGYVSIKLSSNDELHSLKVYKMTGQIMFEINQFDSNKIYLGDLKPGVYFIKINNLVSKKVIVL